MDPTGGAGCVGFFIVLAIIGIAWLLLPQAWAVGVTVGICVLFFALLFFVFSNARFT